MIPGFFSTLHCMFSFREENMADHSFVPVDMVRVTFQTGAGSPEGQDTRDKQARLGARITSYSPLPELHPNITIKPILPRQTMMRFGNLWWRSVRSCRGFGVPSRVFRLSFGRRGQLLLRSLPPLQCRTEPPLPYTHIPVYVYLSSFNYAMRLPGCMHTGKLKQISYLIWRL